MNTPLRLFFALWPDELTRSALARLQFDLDGNKTRYRNFHITLAFLGEQDASQLPLLQEVLAQLDAPEMTLQIDRRAHFARNKIAYAGLGSAPPELKKMQMDLVEALRLHGIHFADQAIFKPHFTLARDASAPPALEFTPIAWHAKQVTLMQSVQAPDGLQYQVLASHWLRRV